MAISGADDTFLLNGGNHKNESFVNYPFAIFRDMWEQDVAVNDSWDNKLLRLAWCDLDEEILKPMIPVLMGGDRPARERLVTRVCPRP